MCVFCFLCVLFALLVVLLECVFVFAVVSSHSCSSSCVFRLRARLRFRFRFLIRRSVCLTCVLNIMRVRRCVFVFSDCVDVVVVVVCCLLVLLVLVCYDVFCLCVYSWCVCYVSVL